MMRALVRDGVLPDDVGSPGTGRPRACTSSPWAAGSTARTPTSRPRGLIYRPFTEYSRDMGIRRKLSAVQSGKRDRGGERIFYHQPQSFRWLEDRLLIVLASVFSLISVSPRAGWCAGCPACPGAHRLRPRRGGPGLTPHGKRHGLKVWMDEDQIADVLKSERLGHDEPGMRGVYGHVSPSMREELKAALQARWEKSLRQRAALSPVSAVPVLNRLLAGIRTDTKPVRSRLAPKIGHRER